LLAMLREQDRGPAEAHAGVAGRGEEGACRAVAGAGGEDERAFVEDRLNSQIIGGPEAVRRGIDELVSATKVDELMITTMTYDSADRWHSFEIVAEVCGLAAQGVAAAAG